MSLRASAHTSVAIRIPLVGDDAHIVPHTEPLVGAIHESPASAHHHPAPVIASQCAHWRGNPFPPRRGRCQHRPAHRAPRRGDSRIARFRTPSSFPCHCEPVRALAWQSVLPPPVGRCTPEEDSRQPTFLRNGSACYGLSHGLKIARQLSIFAPVCGLVPPFRVPSGAKKIREGF